MDTTDIPYVAFFRQPMTSRNDLVTSDWHIAITAWSYTCIPQQSVRHFRFFSSGCMSWRWSAIRGRSPQPTEQNYLSGILLNEAPKGWNVLVFFMLTLRFWHLPKTFLVDSELDFNIQAKLFLHSSTKLQLLRFFVQIFKKFLITLIFWPQ